MSAHRIAGLVVLLAAGAAAAPTPFTAEQTAEIRAIVDALYRIDYARAADLSRQLTVHSPDDPTGYIFLARTAWQEELNRKHAMSLDRFAAPDFFVEQKQYRYRLRVSAANQERFERSSAQAIERAKQMLDRDADDERARFLLGLAYQNLATYHASFTGSWWEAVRAGTATRKLHSEVRARYPEFADPLLAMGVYEYAAGSIGTLYKLFGWLLGIHGDRATGLRMLATVAAQGQLLDDDARTMLVLIYTREKRYEEAQQVLRQLGERFPENYLVPLDAATISLRRNRPDEALATLGQVRRDVERNAHGFGRMDRGMVENQVGMALRRKKSFAEAEAAFLRSLETPGVTQQSLVVAHLELGKTLDLMGRHTDAVVHYRAVMAAEDVAGSREEAGRLARNGYTGGP
jgi:tetratricopeptide (TPR) repeat protein